PRVLSPDCSGCLLRRAAAVGCRWGVPVDAVVVSFAPGTAVRAAGAVLFLGACAVLALVGVVAWRASPRSRTRRPDPVDCARLRAEADALAAHAASLARAS